MATSLIGGLIANQHQASLITACDIEPERLQELRERFQIRTSGSGMNAAGDAEIVMLAVKPQVMRVV